MPYLIIGGAMKSGTTSIHHHLGSHPDVFIPREELFFFDSDDVVQHPQLLRRHLVLPDYRQELSWRLDRYRAWFAGASEGQLVGEDTTTYLASEKAPERIAELLPDVKLVFVLRDPVDRAYSHYWHMVRNGQAFFRFEATLEHMTGTILQRGLYKRQLERYLRSFPRRQVHVVIFEEFRASPQRVIDEVCRFLGLNPSVEVGATGEHRHNAATGVRHPRLYRSVNLLLSGPLGHSRAVQTPFERSPDEIGKRADRWWVRSLLFDVDASYPPLDPHTRARLGRYYTRENAGLAELLDRDPAALWPG